MAQHSSRGILPLDPLHNDCVRPPERGAVRARIALSAAAKHRLFSRRTLNRAEIYQTTRSKYPRQEAEWRCCVEGRLAGCQTRHVGPRMARLADPRSSAGMREVWRSQTRMSGALSLWLLSLLREQRESDSPRGETVISNNKKAALKYQSPATASRTDPRL